MKQCFIISTFPEGLIKQEHLWSPQSSGNFTTRRDNERPKGPFGLQGNPGNGSGNTDPRAYRSRVIEDRCRETSNSFAVLAVVDCVTPDAREL